VEEGEGGQAVKKRLHLIFHCPPLVCALPEKPGTWLDPRLAASSSLQLMLISWAVLACFLHWKVAAHGPPNISHFSLATYGFYEWGF